MTQTRRDAPLDVAAGLVLERAEAHPGKPELRGDIKLCAGPLTSASSAGQLMRYLGSGMFQPRQPLRRQQRETRNRILCWIGLSVLALWLIYVLVR